MDLLPDSVILIPFKDNVECYYGLKNRRGDTILTPQFDQIEPFGQDLFKAKIGTKVVMLRKDGKILTKNTMNDIAPVALNIGYGSSSDRDNLSQADFSFYEALTSYPQYFNFKVGEKFGLIGLKGLPFYPLSIRASKSKIRRRLSLKSCCPIQHISTTTTAALSLTDKANFCSTNATPS